MEPETMTNEQSTVKNKEACIQRLARRLGDRWVLNKLASHDALRPVLATMTEMEWDKLYFILNRIYCEDYSFPPTPAGRCRFNFTIDPQQLAFAIAEALTDSGQTETEERK